MKIAYILKMYPRFSETFIVNEILELERQGVDVRVYSLRKPDDGRFHAKLAQVKAEVIYVPTYPQLEVERITAAHRTVQQAFPDRYAAVHGYSLQRGHDSAIKRFLQAGFVAAHLQAHPVDAMHAHFATSATRVANLVWRMCGVPYSVTAHAKDIFHESVNPSSLRSKLEGARFVATVSQFNQRYLYGMLDGVQADIRVLYNGIDIDHFAPPVQQPSLERPRILAVGRLVEKKGFHHLIDACAILRERGLAFECHIVGKGAWHEQLAQQIAAHALADRVILRGALPQNEVRDAYRAATLFTLPCVIGADGNRDGLPTVMLEAMACGLPVVTTPTTGNPEIVDHQVNGLLVRAADAVALADGLEALLTDPAQRAAMSVAARRKVERCFDGRRQVRVLHDWLAEPIEPAAIPSTEQVSEPLPLPMPVAPTLREAFSTLLTPSTALTSTA